jgi:hypothetical protein
MLAAGGIDELRVDADALGARKHAALHELRSARSRATVRSSSEPASLLYPATSAARIAASFLVSAMVALHHTRD